MSTQNKDEVFTEMMIGMHGLLLLSLTTLHFQLMKSSQPWAVAALVAYGLVFFMELWFYARPCPKVMVSALEGYFKSLMNTGFVAVFCLFYPVLFSFVLPLQCLLILLFSLRFGKTRAVVHGTLNACIFLILALTLPHHTVESTPAPFGDHLMQALTLIVFSWVVQAINGLFDAVYQRNHHAMEEIAYKNALLEKSARTDFLTDMVNHQTFYQALDLVASKCAPVALILFDIDNFKRINDTFGHLAGDYVIREVAQLIKSQLRATDIAARYGGEEFAVLLPSSSSDAGAQIAERIRISIAKHAFELDGTPIHVTVSGGVGMSTVCLDKLGQSVFVDRVDELLYVSKRSGKNQITIQSFENTNSGADHHDLRTTVS